MSKEGKGTEVALANPHVASNISLNLNQNDMIEVVIEHKLEELGARLELEDKAIADIKKRKSDFYDSLKVRMTKRIGAEREDLKKFHKIAKQLGLKIKEESHVNVITYGEKTKEVGSYNYTDIDHCEKYKDPHNYAKRNASSAVLTLQPLDTLYIKLEGSAGELSLKYKSEAVEPTAEESEEHDKFMMAILKEELKLRKEHYLTCMEYLEFKYGERRIKAKIVKASLSKSDEGRGILKMLESATNIKLIG